MTSGSDPMTKIVIRAAGEPGPAELERRGVDVGDIDGVERKALTRFAGR